MTRRTSEDEINPDWPIVVPDDDGIRPAGRPDECFYCKAKVGDPHGPRCVIVEKLVRLRYIIEVDVRVPHCWTTEDIEGHRNESSWCADNAIDDIEAHIRADATDDCLCPRFKAEVVTVLDDTPTRERGVKHGPQPTPHKIN